MLAVQALFPANILNTLRNIVDKPRKAAQFRRVQSMKETRAGGDGPPTRARTRRPKLTRPEPGSIYDILHDHAGETLHVPPLCWTDRHTTVLGVKFQELEPITTPVPETQGNVVPREPTKFAMRLTELLYTTFKTPQVKSQTDAFNEIMRGLFPNSPAKPRTVADLDMFLGNKVCSKAIRLPLSWWTPSTPDNEGFSFDSSTTFDSMATNPVSPELYTFPELNPVKTHPVLTYFPRSHLRAIRHNLYRVPRAPDGKINEPVRRLQELRSKALVPANPEHDAHFVAILTAMAQAHCYEQFTVRVPKPSHKRPMWPVYSRDPTKNAPANLHDVKVQLMTHEVDEDDATLIIYTASVSAQFLARFDNPLKAPPTTDQLRSGMHITYNRVNVFPLMGLRERLRKVLSEEFVGEPRPSDPERIVYGSLVRSERKRRCSTPPCSMPMAFSQDLIEPDMLFTPHSMCSPNNKRKRREPGLELGTPARFPWMPADEDGVCAGEDAPLSPRAKRRRVAQSVQSSLEVC